MRGSAIMVALTLDHPYLAIELPQTVRVICTLVPSLPNFPPAFRSGGLGRLEARN